MTKLTMSSSKDNIEYFIDDKPVTYEQYLDMVKYLGGEVVSSECNTVLCESASSQQTVQNAGAAECVELVKQLAAWSKKYPRSGIYAMHRKPHMDGELIEMENKAKKIVGEHFDI